MRTGGVEAKEDWGAIQEALRRQEGVWTTVKYIRNKKTEKMSWKAYFTVPKKKSRTESLLLNLKDSVKIQIAISFVVIDFNFIHIHSKLTVVDAPAVQSCWPQDESADEKTVEKVEVNQIPEENKVGLHAHTKPACNRQETVTICV